VCIKWNRIKIISKLKDIDSLSAKFDIWPLGLIIHEIIFLKKLTGRDDYFPEKWEEEFIKIQQDPSSLGKNRNKLFYRENFNQT
jgi:hypothetical protein